MGQPGADPAPGLQESFSRLPRMLNATLAQSAAAIRDHFRGPVRDSLRSYARFGKPVVVSEFGCCTDRQAHVLEPKGAFWALAAAYRQAV